MAPKSKTKKKSASDSNAQIQYISAENPAESSAAFGILNTPTQFRPDWELHAETVLHTVAKHPFVDHGNKRVLANFYAPASTEDLLNLHSLSESLLYGGVPDAEVFCAQIKRIFQRVVEQYPGDEIPDFMKKIVYGCRHLVQYVSWLCLENLPLQGQTGEPLTSDSPFLLVTRRDNERTLREQILDNSPIEPPGTVCRKMIKDLERCKNKMEQTQLSYFVVPVNDKLLADYSVYVRKPMDLSTVKGKLDATMTTSSSSLESSQKYRSYGEFLKDLRLIFSNAIKYNKAHLESDTTGLSQHIYDAAVTLQARLESIIASFTVTTADKAFLYSQEREDLDIREMKRREEEAEMERILKKHQEEFQMKLMAEDSMYAHDLDKEAKRKELLQQAALIEAKERAMAPELAEDPFDHSVAYDEYREQADQKEEYTPSHIPKWFAPLVPLKEELTRRAWDYFASTCGVSSYEGSHTSASAGWGDGRPKVINSSSACNGFEITATTAEFEIKSAVAVSGDSQTGHAPSSIVRSGREAVMEVVNVADTCKTINDNSLKLHLKTPVDVGAKHLKKKLKVVNVLGFENEG